MGNIDLHATVQAIGLPIDGNPTCLSNSGPMLRAATSPNYGVSAELDNWRGRHNAKKVVKIRTVKPFNTFSLGAAQ